MRHLLAAALALVATVVVAAQSVPRTPWGDPDLQGIWPSGGLITVPFERPTAFGTRALLTEKEYADRAAELQQQAEDDATPISTGTAPSVNPPSHWLEAGRAPLPIVGHRRQSSVRRIDDERGLAGRAAAWPS